MTDSRRVVLISGCSKGGIGYSLCEEFARRGCIVYATARRLASMDGFHDDLGIRTKELDITNNEMVQTVINQVVSEAGRIDILISNAGSLTSGPILDVSIEEAQRTFDVNAFGTMRLAHAVIPHMASRRAGLIVVVGSVGGTLATPWTGVYAASKAALHILSDTLSMECAPLGVQVSLLMPGAVKSNVADTALSHYKMPSNSLYQDYSTSIIQRAALSQSPAIVVDTAEFAREVADKTLVKKPAVHFYAGGSVIIWRIFVLVPSWFAMWFIWRRFGKTNNEVRRNNNLK